MPFREDRGQYRLFVCALRSLCFSCLRQLAQHPHRQPNRVGDALNLRRSFAASGFDFHHPVFNRIRPVNSAAVKSSRNLYPVSRLRHSAARPDAHVEFNRGRARRTSGQAMPARRFPPFPQFCLKILAAVAVDWLRDPPSRAVR